MENTDDLLLPEEQLIDVLRAAEESQRRGYQFLSKRKSRQAERRAAVEARLAETLDKDDPSLRLARLRAAKSNESASAFRQRVRRLRQSPSLSKDDWMVAGNIRYSSGRAGAKLVVQVYDKDLKYDDLLGTATTNEYGDFFVVYDTCQFADEWGNERPDLYLRVMDSSGKILFEHDRPMRINAGRSEYVEIVIDGRG